jgi:hypothetical protein
VFAGIFAEHSPKHRDVLGQVPLLDEDVGPDRLHQFVLADYPPGVFNQHQQSVEDLWRERHDLIVAE